MARGKLDDARKIDKQGITKKEMISILPACLRSSAIASILGAMPGVGAAWPSSCATTRSAARPSTPKSSARVVWRALPRQSPPTMRWSALHDPLLTLGIPGDGVTALLLGAFVLHGIQPGPTMFTKQV